MLLGACSSKVRYPEARSSDHVDTYHGVEVADPYRWLEDPDSPETGRWVRDQNILTQGYLKRIRSRDEIRGRLEKLWNYEKYGVPFSRGGRYFYTRNDGLQNQFVLYTADSLEGEAAVLVDPNTMSKDGTVSTSRYTATRDGRFLAYSIQRAGSDWREWRIRNIASRRDLPDQLSWSKFSPAAWLPDGSGFFYGRYPEPEGGKHQAENVDYKLYFHKRGTLQSADELVYERTDHPKWGFWPWVSEDGRYLVIQVWQGSQREAAIYYKDLQEGGAFVEMLPHFDAEYEFLGNEGSKFWFKTNNDAPNGRIVAIDSANPDPAAWKELIPEAKQTIDEVTVVGERFLVSYLEDAASKVKIFQLEGTPDGEIELPQKGTAMRFSGRRTDTETFYLFTCFTYPWTVFRYDFETKKS